MLFKIISVLLLSLSSSSYNLFSIKNANIVFNNESVALRGINWYGFETDLRVVEGLWKHDMDWYMDILVHLKFNAIRIPISEQLVMYEPTARPALSNIKADKNLYKKSCMEILHILFEKCQKRGIAILLDLHVLKIRTNHPLWYLRGNIKYTELTLFETWEKLLYSFQNYNNLIGIELINEPHDNASFGSGNISTDVDSMVSRFLKAFPDSPLIFVNGIWWGKDFRHLNTSILDPNRIVIAPHFYGPTLAPLPSYTEQYLNWYYNRLFGFLIGKYPIVITEWGFNPDIDTIWVNNFIQYMQNKSISNSFFWSFNPDGKDIKGLLFNWTTIDMIRYNKIKELCPNPTNFSFLS